MDIHFKQIKKYWKANQFPRGIISFGILTDIPQVSSSNIIFFAARSKKP
jgi:hypothetical protein